MLREVLADSAAGSDFIRRDLDALFAGDFMRTFALDRCCEELQIVTELARDHRLPFQVSDSVAELYRPLGGEIVPGKQQFPRNQISRAFIPPCIRTAYCEIRDWTASLGPAARLHGPEP